MKNNFKKLSKQLLNYKNYFDFSNTMPNSDYMENATFGRLKTKPTPLMLQISQSSKKERHVRAVNAITLEVPTFPLTNLYLYFLLG